MTYKGDFDLYVDGKLHWRNVAYEYARYLSKIDPAEFDWAIEECGVCTVLDDAGRELKFQPTEGERLQ